MRHRLRYAQNAVEGNGTVLRGDLYQIGIKGLLGGTTGHRIWEANAVAQYSLGARFTTGDGRVFRYAKAAATLIPGQGCRCHRKQIVAYRSVAAATLAGATQVSLTITTADGATGVIAKDELQGGYVVIFDATSTNLSSSRMIIGNTATSATSLTLTLTLENGLPLALTTSDHGECMASPYKDVVTSGSEVCGIVGVPCVAATVGQYLWIQTWGVCWVACQLDAGTELMDRQLVWRHDGSCDKHDDSDAKNEYAQHAGFILQNGTDDETPTQGAPFIMLQISI